MMSFTSLLWIAFSIGRLIAHPTTAPAFVPPAFPFAYPHVAITQGALFGRLAGPELHKRRDQCDQSQFFCPTGTCFTDPSNGYIGCCSVSTCVPRTTCIEYSPSVTQPCDPDTGGCLYCSNSANPYCMVITNEGAGQWIEYCATTSSTETISYQNIITTGSLWQGPLTVAARTSTQTLPTTSSTSSASPLAQNPVATSTTSSSRSTVVTATTTTSAGGALAAGDEGDNKSATHTSLPGGAIGGGVAGAVFCLLAIAVAIYFTRRRHCASSKRSDSPVSKDEKASPDADSPPSTGTASNPAEAEGTTPRQQSYYYSPSVISRGEEADSRPVSMAPHPAVRPPQGPTRGLGIDNFVRRSSKRVSRYTISNPDQPAVKSVKSPTVHPNDIEAPPIVSPLTSSANSQDPVSTPHSLRTAHLGHEVPYTPSTYAAEPPGSIPRTAAEAPPSLAQQYSSAALPQDGSTATLPNRSAGLYRGLSVRAGESTPPWAYLSPEHAVNGGWRNGAESPVKDK